MWIFFVNDKFVMIMKLNYDEFLYIKNCFFLYEIILKLKMGKFVKCIIEISFYIEIGMLVFDINLIIICYLIYIFLFLL